MNPELRRRLDEVERKLGSGGQIITVPLYLDETEEDGKRRLARWRNGDDVEGVSVSPSVDGSTAVIYLVDFGQLRDGTKVTRENYEFLLTTQRWTGKSAQRKCDLS